MKIFIPMIIFLLLSVPNIYADTVILKNGGELEGNVLKVTNTHLILDLVARNKLLGGIIKLTLKEIKSYKIDGKYHDLKVEENKQTMKPKTNLDRAKDILRLKNALQDEGKFKRGRL